MGRQHLVRATVMTMAVTLAAPAQQRPQTLVLTGITVIDGTGAPPVSNMTLVIDGDRITQLFRGGEKQLPPNADVRDLRGHYVIPGLIDAHVHVGAPHLQNGTMRRLLRGGVTTVRNMVGNCEVLRDMSRRAASGEIESPDIYYSAVVGGAAMRADPRGARPQGTGPGMQSGCGQLLGSSFNPMDVVTLGKNLGVTGLKLYADISAADATRLTEEAHRQGLVVWAHATLFPARPSDVVQAGADVLSHAAYLSWETVDSLPSYRNRVRLAPFGSAKPNDPVVEHVLRMMAQRGTILDATLYLFHAQATNPQPSPNEDFQVDRSTLEAAAKWAAGVTRRARELGVLVSAGTDGQGAQTEGSLPNLHVELELLANEAGFPPLEAIRSATSIAARTMRLDSLLGSVAVGKQADLVVLRSDPTVRIGNTRDIALVIKRGKVIEGSVAAPMRAQDRLAITSATVVDGRTGRATSGLTILIEADRIVAVGPRNGVRIPEGTTTIDGTGKWVAPGYIDVHTHSTPPAVMQRALSLGVTTMHMMPSRPAPSDSLRDFEVRSNTKESLTPRLRITSPLFTGTFPGNVLLRVTNFVKPQSVADVERMLPELLSGGFRGIKIIQDDGKLWSGMETVVPRLNDDVFSALVQNAHRLGMTVYAHVTQLRDTEQAIAARADVFIHGTMDSVLSDAQWKRMREQRTVWAPAFRIVAEGADRAAYARRILADPILRASLSPAEMEAFVGDTARTRKVDEPFAALPRNGSDYVRMIAENTRRARQHGVTIAVGSDAGVSGNGPGIGTHMEMEFLQEAGLTPAEVIVASTFGGAVALRMQDQSGTIEAGKLADLVILGRNPLVDIRNARAIEWVIKAGKAVRPNELLPPKGAASGSQPIEVFRY